ncbi:MAG TPA: hypothetical protein PLI53_11670 [Geobacteraceae bacterium]|nr:hypothetical protein [Geobacteraceae bacterium]
MKRYLVLLLIVAALGGCATISKTDKHALEQQKKLTLAKMLLENNRPVATRKILNEISGAPTVAGVTDEALFRLALLDLEAGKQKFATDKAEKNLNALLTKFNVTSSWSSHAVTLKGLFEAYDSAIQEKAELEKTVRSLKISNASLAKENSDLRQNLEKIKKLDLELEMKKKR